MSRFLTWLLILAYLLLSASNLWDKHPWKAVYWIAAAVITLAVEKM